MSESEPKRNLKPTHHVPINPINTPKNGKSNATYAKEHGITKRQASKRRMSEQRG